METYFIIYLAATFLITSLGWYIYLQSVKNKYQILKNDHANLNSNLDKEVIVKADQNVAELQQTISDLKVEISDTKHKSYIEGYERARSEFSVKVFAHKNEYSHGDAGIFINDIYHRVEVGYKYQLFVNGLPVLQPAIIIEEVLEESKREVDYTKIESAIKSVENALKPLIANSNGLIKLIPKQKSK